MTPAHPAPVVRPLVAVDLTAAHALNEAAVPAVNALDLDDFAASAARGRGVGRALYAAVAARAVDAGLGRITCEVNLAPPNPGSMAFHLREGFAEVGRQHTDAGAKQVALLERPL